MQKQTPTITVQIVYSSEHQTADLMEILRLHGQVVRVSIHLESDLRSIEAKIETYKRLRQEWVQLHSIHPALMQSKFGNLKFPHDKTREMVPFESDYKELIRTANEILNPKDSIWNKLLNK